MKLISIVYIVLLLIVASPGWLNSDALRVRFFALASKAGNN